MLSSEYDKLTVFIHEYIWKAAESSVVHCCPLNRIEENILSKIMVKFGLKGPKTSSSLHLHCIITFATI